MVKFILIEEAYITEEMLSGHGVPVSFSGGTLMKMRVTPNQEMFKGYVEYTMDEIKAMGSTPKASKLAEATNAFKKGRHGTKSIYTRVIGYEYSMTVGENIIDITVPYESCLITELAAIGSTELDKLTVQVGAIVGGTFYSGDEFSTTANMPEGFYDFKSDYAAELKDTMTMRITYEAKVAKDIGFNLTFHEVK